MSASARVTVTSEAPLPAATLSRALVGVDGSDEAIEAARQAALLAQGPVALLAVYDIGSRIVGATGTSALVGASRIVDLVVVGSRGLHGLKALGSVSERVAHQAECSVLIVREAPWQQAAESEVNGA